MPRMMALFVGLRVTTSKRRGLFRWRLSVLLPAPQCRILLRASQPTKLEPETTALGTRRDECIPAFHKIFSPRREFRASVFNVRVLSCQATVASEVTRIRSSVGCKLAAARVWEFIFSCGLLRGLGFRV